jgi:hypothetical protein
MLGRMIVRGIEYHPAPPPTPAQMNRRRHVSSVVIALVLIAWFLWYHH